MKEKSVRGEDVEVSGDRRRSAARILIGIQILMALAWVILFAGWVFGSIEEFDPFAIGFVMIMSIYSVVGYLVVVRQPDNPIGLMLCAVGPIWLVSVVGDAYAQLRLDGDPLPGAVWASWTGNWVWAPAMGLIGIFLLLHFPDGHLPSRRWRPAFWIGLLGTVLATLSVALEETRLEGGYANPLVASGWFADVVSSTGFPIFLVSFLVAAASLVVRMRGSTGEQRQQMKWLIYPAALVGPLLILAAAAEAFGGGCRGGCGSWEVIGAIGWFGMLGMVLLGFPIAMGIAILKYRLYDIDVVINKTLVFGALAAFITGIYVAVVVGIGELLGSAEEPNLALSIAATALVAIAFQPVKERTQRVANRIVYGARSTPYEVMANLSRAASGAIEPHDILPSVAAVAASGVGARATRVSLVLHSGEALEATHPEDLDDEPTYDVVVPLTHRDETIGELAVAKAAGEQLSPGDSKLLEDLAAQAALALHNARLAIELGARLDEISVQATELDASRRRIVSAQDDSRRRLEHDITSGPQRSLEDMRAELAVIKEALGDDRERAAGLLAELAGRANQTLDALRDLARGIFPPLLADKGIVAALVSHIRKHELDVVLEADEGVSAARFEERVEIAVYFCCLEALSARRDGTTISLGGHDGAIEMSCTDVALDDARSESIRDRVEALSGTVEFEDHGERSALRARFPAGVLEVSGILPQRAQPKSISRSGT